MKVHYSSNSYEWETPQDLFDELNSEFRFDVDVCAIPQNAKCKKYFSPIQDGLLQEWNGVCWMNPPYGSQINRWIKKAYISSLKGATVVCLIPSRTDTKWWHNYAMKGEIRFIKGRVKFGGCKDSAPFPSAIIIFKSNELQNPKTINGIYQQTCLFNAG